MAEYYKEERSSHEIRGDSHVFERARVSRQHRRNARQAARRSEMTRTVTIANVCVLAVMALLAGDLSAQNQNPRFGKWKLKSDAPPPASNIMTYEPFGDKGMKVTIDAVNAKGEVSQWWYTTNFDGKDMPVTGNRNQTHSSVRVINDRVNEIINKDNGKVTQVLTNVLSPDGDTIAVVYMRDDGAGKTTNVTFATYERIK
jgi:hypothetical protein